MSDEYRNRCGYCWATEGENKERKGLIKESSLYKYSDIVKSKADFIRISAFVVAHLLKYKNFSPDSKNEEELIRSIIYHFRKRDDV